MLSISRNGTRPPSLLAHPAPLLGVIVAAVLIVAETLLVRLLAQAAPHDIYGGVFLLGVLVISAGWGFWLAVLTTLARPVASFT